MVKLHGIKQVPSFNKDMHNREKEWQLSTAEKRSWKDKEQLQEHDKKKQKNRADLLSSQQLCQVSSSWAIWEVLRKVEDPQLLVHPSPFPLSRHLATPVSI
jgi:hypothetical protein